MKRILFILFIQLSAIFSLMADDGGTTNVEDWTYGNIYVKEPNDKIALEKELMVCSMDSITAIFVFKNTTDDTVAVDCAFPIDVVLPYTIENVKENEYELWRCYSFRVLRMLLGTKDTIDPKEVVGLGGSIAINDRIKELVQQHDKELRVMSWKNYVGYIDSLELENTMSTSFSENSYIPECEIEQNGQFVDIQNVGIESSVSSKEIKMQFHFHHQLKFLPNAYSKVVVKYRVESMKQNYNGEYGYTYDISTGGTWKNGIINSFMLITQNCDLYDRHSKQKFEYICLDELEHCGIHSIMNFKPSKNEYFKFVQNYIVGYEHDAYPYPEYKDLKYITLKDLNASPSWKNIEAMMDKDRFTSCAITDWKNATLEFTLPKDAYGPYMYNGTIGTIINKENFDSYIESLKIDTISPWEIMPDDPSVYDYNRVNEILIERLDGDMSDSISLNVEYTDPRKFPCLFDWYRFNHIETLHFFPAGKYRLSIKGINPGVVTQDTTCITEFCFLPIGACMAEILKNDYYSEIPIFQKIFDMTKFTTDNSSVEKKDTVSVVEPMTMDTVPSTVISATPKVVILNREIPLSVLIGALIFTVLIILGCVYWQKKHKI